MVGGWGWVVGTDALLSSSPSLIWLSWGFGLACYSGRKQHFSAIASAQSETFVFLGIERPKMAIFGCFRPIMGLFLIESEGFGHETLPSMWGY